MYEHFFGLSEPPFNGNPDPRYFWSAPQVRKTLSNIIYGIESRAGLILLTGEAGTGKTTLMNLLLEWRYQQQMPSAFLFNSRLEPGQLLDFVLSEFQVPSAPGSKAALIALNQWLMARFRMNQIPLLIVDEAQGLPRFALEEIRMLSNLETPQEKLLPIVIAGQPEFEAELRRPELRHIHQRVAVRCRTAPLNVEETRTYIESRLRMAGANGSPIFSPAAIDAVCRHSRGIPRVVNLLCEHALMTAYADQVRPVPAEIVDEVARELQFDDVRLAAPQEKSDDAAEELIAMVERCVGAQAAMKGTASCKRRQDAAADIFASAAFHEASAPLQERIALSERPASALSFSKGLHLVAQTEKEHVPDGLGSVLRVVEGSRDPVADWREPPCQTREVPAENASESRADAADRLADHGARGSASRGNWRRVWQHWASHAWPAWIQSLRNSSQRLAQPFHRIARACYRSASAAWKAVRVTDIHSVGWKRIRKSAVQWLNQPWKARASQPRVARRARGRRRVNYAVSNETVKFSQSREAKADDW